MDYMVRAIKAKVGSPLRKLVLIKLADNACDQGECWPSYQHIADQCEMSKRAVMVHIQSLIDAGFLVKEIRKGGPKGNSSNVYKMTLGGAGNALGVVQDIHQGSANAALPSANAALGGSANAAPRTSHSFESINEPVIEPIAPQPAAAVEVPGQLVLVSDSPRVELPADMPGPKDQDCKTFKAWANYAIAYRKRYNTWPVWNAKAAGQIGKLVDRLGIDVAHGVAAYYLLVNDAWIVRACHSLGMLLQEAESFHTQWITGRQMNGRTARQIEDTQANLNAAQEAASRLRDKGAKKNAFL